MDDEPGGVASIGSVTYAWLIDEHDYIHAFFDSGECMTFENGADGWATFITYAIVLGGLL